MLPFLLLSLLPIALTSANEQNHLYDRGEPVHMYFNKVGPYHNPQETYSYFSLPFCGESQHLNDGIKYAGLGAILEGHGMYVHSGMEASFTLDAKENHLCTKTLSAEDAQQFQHAVLHHYWYQMYIDDLPVWGMVGEVYDHPTLERNGVGLMAKNNGVASFEQQKIRLEGDNKKLELNHDNGQNTDIADNKDVVAEDADVQYSVYVYTHKKLSIAYNQKHIVEVNLTSEDPQLVKEGAVFDFRYDVTWVDKPSQSFDKRFERYLDYSFFEHQIHWFSIFNSFMMVIFLVGLVTLILIRTLRNDYAKYMRDEEDLDETERGVGEESGWKQVHGDVFRTPPHLTLFTALYGAGHQLLLLFLMFIFLSIAASLYVERGAVVTTFIVCYGVTSAWAGYMSGSFYKHHFYRDSPGWKNAMALTASILPISTMGIMFTLNGISLAYGSHSIPTTAAISLVLLWLFVAVPLTIGGTLLGRHMSPNASWPCRVHAIPGLVPEHPWYRQRLVIALVSGLLPFGSIFIEMWFIFTSFWNYKFYFVYGFMLLVYGILFVVTVCVTIVAVYYLLNGEDYRWWWLSFLSGGSCSVYLFLYSIYYFFAKTHMHGFLQIAFYFGYTTIFCFSLFLTGGAIGHMGAKWFVHKIYSSIRID